MKAVTQSDVYCVTVGHTNGLLGLGLVRSNTGKSAAIKSVSQATLEAVGGKIQLFGRSLTISAAKRRITAMTWG